tara:strand:- start:4577 stop:8260 length:3684 start_codon:yes stop_codon:yes gene_type:complete
MAQAILDIEIKGIKEAQVSMDALSASIIKVEQNQKQLNQQRKDLEKRLATNQKALQELNRAYAEGEMTEKEYAAATQAVEMSNDAATKALVRNKTAIANNKAELADLSKEQKQSARLVNAQADTLDELRRKLALAQTEYGKLDQSTEKGRQAAERFAAEINKLSTEVKEQEAAIGDNRRNVGNYGDALKGVTPFLGSFGAKLDTMVSGLSGMTEALNGANENLGNIGGTAAQAGASVGGIKGAFQAAAGGIAQATRSAIAFIATPIGAAIAALAAIGTATKAWFDYNNEIRKTNSLLAGITGQTGDTLNNIRRQTDALQETLGIGAEESAQAAKVLVEQFGISYEEALNKMQTGILATNGTNDEFLQSIGEYSTFFADAGFSVENFTGIVNAGFDLGIYTDKLPDALKEADLRLREQTNSTRDALVNAFDEEFTDNLFSNIDKGSISTAEALETIRAKAEETGLGQQALAQVTADLFAGAGEDAGGAIKVFDALTVGMSGTSNELDEFGEQLQNEISRTVTLAEQMDEALMSENFIAFQEGLTQIGHSIKIGLVQGLSFVMDGITPVIEAFKTLGAALGLTGESAVSLGDVVGFVVKVALTPFRLVAEAVALGVRNLSAVIGAIKNVFKGAGIAVINMAKKFEPFRKAMMAVKRGVSSFVNAFREGFAAVRATLDGVTAYGEAVLGSLGDALEFIGEGKFKKAYNAIDGIGTAGERAFNRAYNAAMNSVEATNAVTDAADQVIEVIEEEEEVLDANTDATDKNTEAKDNNRQAEERRLKAINDIINKEIERNMTEEELLTKRLNDKLRELELDKDITKLTQQELDAREALFAKYNDDIQAIRDEADEEERLANEKRRVENVKSVKEGFDERLAVIEQELTLQSLTLETAHLNDLRNFQGTEEEKLALIKSFQMQQLQLQKDAIQSQIQAIEDSLDFASPEDMLAGLDAGIIDESSDALIELRNALAQVNFQMQETGKDEEGEPKSFTEQLGVDPDNIEKALMALDVLQDGFAIAQQAIGAAETARLAAVDKQVEQGVITEEQAEKKKEKISKKAARQQQAISIVQAMINTAQGITKTLATLPPPFAQIVAATIAAQGAVQIATIKAQKFAKGGILNGPSHAQGGIPMFSKGGAFYGEAEGGEAVLTKGVMKNPALASMASAINVAGGGVPFFENGGVLQPIQSATPTDRAADLITAGLKSRQPVLVVEQLRERENSVNVIESLRTIG